MKLAELLDSIPIYVLALPERADAVLTELASQGLSAQIIPAIDKRGDPLPPNWKRRASDVGASMSWLKVLDIIAELSRVPFAAVFEDDFIFRLDTLKDVPDRAEIDRLDFDAIYMTGHYAKGATKVEPKRIPISEHMVRAIGVHTLPARLINVKYARILADAIRNNMAEHGFGADTTDAILQAERGKTYAFEAHIGGQRSADNRSWEPRFWDYGIRGGIEVIHEYPGWKGAGDIDETLAWRALASRFKNIIAINCSVRTLGAISESMVAVNGGVRAFNSEKDFDAFQKRTCDRLKRYLTYRVLSLSTFESLASLETADCVCVEMKQVAEDREVVNALKLVPPEVMDGVTTVISNRYSDDLTRGAVQAAFPLVRLYRSFGSIYFLARSGC